MTEREGDAGASLVLHASQHLLAPQTAPDRILGEMVESSLALAKDSVVAPADLDALVREAEKLYRSNGDGMTEENMRAFRLFRHAAQAGHPKAQNYVGECYYTARGIEGDYVEAAKWYRKAAEQGNTGAQYNLGICLHKGQGVPENHVEAITWYRRAAEQGNVNSQYELGSYPISMRGDGMDFSGDRNQEYKEGVEWLRRAAEQGHRDAQGCLGYYYRVGSSRLPFSRNILESYKWLQLAADQDRKNAKEQVEALTTSMSPTELRAAQRLYRDFKETHPAKE